MPCAAGEVCLLQGKTPSAPDGHECRGGCGGPLHGICGDIAPEGADEQARMCPKCVVDSQKKSTAAPSGAASAGVASAARKGKRKSSSTGGPGSSKKIQSGAPKKGKGASRTRLSFHQKIDILQRLDDGSTHSSLADRYNCGERTISRVQEEREELKERAASATTKGGAKSNRKGGFPKVDELAMDLLEKARKAKSPVTRAAIMAFGRSATKTLLGGTVLSAAEREKLEGFKAGEKWARNFVRRRGLVSKNLDMNLDMSPGEAAGEAAIEGLKEWVTLEDQEYVVEALRLDAGDEMAEHLNGTYEEDVGGSDDEAGGSDGESEGGGGIEPPPYSQLSQYFGPLERAAGESGNCEAVFLLQKAKMAMIKAHASKTVRQSDMREFI